MPSAHTLLTLIIGLANLLVSVSSFNFEFRFKMKTFIRNWYATLVQLIFLLIQCYKALYK